MVGPYQSHGLLRLEKKSVVGISSHVNYSMDHLFDFSSWKQWDPVQNKFDKRRTNSVVKPMCVRDNFGFCSSGVLRPDVVHGFGSYDLKMSLSGDKGSVGAYEIINVSSIHFKLLAREFHNVRPVYELMSDANSIPYYLYHESGKWRVGPEIGSDIADSGIILEMKSEVMRVEYEQQWLWYVVGRSLRSALRHLRCSHESAADVVCESASTDVCLNGGSCRVDSAGTSTCVCAPDFRGSHCEKPVAKCKQSVTFDAPSFAFGDREGSVMSTFCPHGKVQFSVCNGVRWWPYGCHSSLDPLRVIRGGDPAAKIALVLASLIGFQLILPFICYCCVSCCKFDENKLISEENLSARKRLTKFLRACSGFFYLSWWAWFAYLMYYLCVWHGDIALDGTTIWSAVAIMAIICICLLYVVVLCESICSHEYEYLTKVKDLMLAEELIARMKSELPTIKFKADCWHSETRTRTVLTSCTLAFSFLVP